MFTVQFPENTAPSKNERELLFPLDDTDDVVMVEELVPEEKPLLVRDEDTSSTSVTLDEEDIISVLRIFDIW